MLKKHLLLDNLDFYTNFEIVNEKKKKKNQSNIKKCDHLDSKLTS